VASAVVVSATRVYYIFNDDLHLKPFKFHLCYKLEDQNNEKRMNLPHPFLKQPESTQAVRNMR